MKKQILLSTMIAVGIVYSSAFAQSSKEMLESFTRNWHSKKMKIEKLTRIGIVLQDDDDFTIVLDSLGKAVLESGTDKPYYFHYTLTKELLKKLYNGQLNALTAMGAARSTDQTPLDVGFKEGNSPDEHFLPFFLSFSFHFWNKSWPEKVQFGESNSRMVHGGLATVFYYQQGLRTAWYKLKPGMHSNKDPEDQKNPFPSIFIITKGKGTAKFDGKVTALKEGETYFIPADMSHEFWCGKSEMECIMIAFGKGA